MKVSLRPLFALPLAAAALAAPLAAHAQSIGASFGDGSALTNVAATDVVGAPGFAQANFTNLTTATGTALRDSSGTATTVAATVTRAIAGDNLTFSPIRTAAADASERFNNGIVYTDLGGLNLSLTNIPYASYSIVLYSLNAVTSAPERFTIGSTTLFVRPPANPIGAGYLDNNAATPFTYIRSTGATAATAAAGSDYVVFTGLSGSSQTVSILGNSSDGGSTFPTDIGGFQIVATAAPVPEPATLAALGLGAAALLRRRRSA